jgi:hypothetical protein
MSGKRPHHHSEKEITSSSDMTSNATNQVEQRVGGSELKMKYSLNVTTHDLSVCFVCNTSSRGKPIYMYRYALSIDFYSVRIIIIIII